MARNKQDKSRTTDDAFFTLIARANRSQTNSSSSSVILWQIRPRRTTTCPRARFVLAPGAVQPRDNDRLAGLCAFYRGAALTLCLHARSLPANLSYIHTCPSFIFGQLGTGTFLGGIRARRLITAPLAAGYRLPARCRLRVQTYDDGVLWGCYAVGVRIGVMWWAERGGLRSCYCLSSTIRPLAPNRKRQLLVEPLRATRASRPSLIFGSRSMARRVFIAISVSAFAPPRESSVASSRGDDFFDAARVQRARHCYPSNPSLACTRRPFPVRRSLLRTAASPEIVVLQECCGRIGPATTLRWSSCTMPTFRSPPARLNLDHVRALQGPFFSPTIPSARRYFCYSPRPQQEHDDDYLHIHHVHGTALD